MPAATKDKQEEKVKPPSDTERIDRLEAAISNALGVTLADFDSEEVKRAHQQAAEEAEKKARALIEKTISEAVKPLTAQERLERLEQVAQTSLGVTLEQPAEEEEEE
jgi:N-methylhydantoinase A/oxoprolinase/acetone carboxylase beta subunit